MSVVVFWRERGGEERRDPARKMFARRLMSRAGRWLVYAGVATSRDVTRHVARLYHVDLCNGL
jgi:hypothetical protein